MEQIRRGAVVFNPPPGWPPAPPGWLPSLDWKPPKNWPEMPAGWHIFLELPPDDDEDIQRVSAAHPAQDFHPAYTGSGSGTRSFSAPAARPSGGLGSKWHRRLFIAMVFLASAFVMISVSQIITMQTAPAAAVSICMNRAWEEGSLAYPQAAANNSTVSGLSMSRSTITVNGNGSITVSGYTTVAPDGIVLGWTCTAMKDTTGVWTVTGFDSAVEAEPVVPVSTAVPASSTQTVTR